MIHITFTTHQVLNITTGVLYTKMDDIYYFFDTLFGKGFMTHMLPNSREAVVPILKEKLPEWMFEEVYNEDVPDKNIDLCFTDEDITRFKESYSKLPSLI